MSAKRRKRHGPEEIVRKLPAGEPKLAQLRRRSEPKFDYFLISK